MKQRNRQFQKTNVLTALLKCLGIGSVCGAGAQVHYIFTLEYQGGSTSGMHLLLDNSAPSYPVLETYLRTFSGTRKYMLLQHTSVRSI